MPKHSGVWKYFVKSDGAAKCKVCHRSVRNSTSNTTNFWRHLKKHHLDPSPKNNKVSPSGIVAVPSSTPSTSLQNLDEIPAKNTKFNEIRILHRKDSDHWTEPAVKNLLVYCMFRHNPPADFLDWVGVKSLIRFLLPSYKIPSCATIAHDVIDMSESIRDSMNAYLQEIEHLSLTVDLWDDSTNHKSYLGMTAHFYDERLVKTTVHLKTIDFSTNDSSVKVAEKLMKMCAEWGIDLHRVVGVTHKNVTVINEAVEIVFSKDRSFHCVAHAISQIAIRIMRKPGVALLIDKANGIATHFENSPTAEHELQRSRYEELQPAQPDDGTWKSYNMLKRFLVIEKDMASNSRKDCDPEMPVQEEVLQIRDLVTLLNLLVLFAKKVSGGKTHVSGSQMIPWTQALRGTAEAAQMSTPFGDSVKEIMLNACNNLCDSIEAHTLAASATILDPRFKRVFFRNAISCNRAVAHIEKGLGQVGNTAVESAATPEGDDLFDRYLNDFLKEKQQRNGIIGPSTTLSRYLDENIVPGCNDPMDFWKDCGPTMENIVRLAKKYLSLTVTAATMERIFSGAGDIIIPDKSTLTPEQLTDIVFRQQIQKADFELLVE